MLHCTIVAMHNHFRAEILTMNNAIFDTTTDNVSAAAELAKKTVAINVEILDKLINFQFSTATNWVDSSISQLKTFTEVNSVDDLAAVSTTLFQSAAKQGQNQAHELSNLVTESGAAYQAVLETANFDRHTTTKAPTAINSVSKNSTPVKAKTKPKSKGT